MTRKNLYSNGEQIMGYKCPHCDKSITCKNNRTLRKLIDMHLKVNHGVAPPSKDYTNISIGFLPGETNQPSKREKILKAEIDTLEAKRRELYIIPDSPSPELLP